MIWVWSQFQDKINITSPKSFLHEFPKKMFIATLNWFIAKVNTTGSAAKRNGMGVICHEHLVLRKMFMLLKHTNWVKKTDLAPTEQFLEYPEYPEKLIFHDGNDVIIFIE